MAHIDTIIRLLDGTRVYPRAVIDNFSRRILAWRVGEQTQVCFTPVGLELPILALIPGLGNVAWRPASDLR